MLLYYERIIEDLSRSKCLLRSEAGEAKDHKEAERDHARLSTTAAVIFGSTIAFPKKQFNELDLFLSGTWRDPKQEQKGRQCGFPKLVSLRSSAILPLPPKGGEKEGKENGRASLKKKDFLSHFLFGFS